MAILGNESRLWKENIKKGRRWVLTVRGNTVFCRFSLGLSPSGRAEVDSRLLPSPTAWPALSPAGSTKKTKKEETLRFQTRVPRIAFLCAAPAGFGVFLQRVKQTLPGQEENQLQHKEKKSKYMHEIKKIKEQAIGFAGQWPPPTALKWNIRLDG